MTTSQNVRRWTITAFLMPLTYVVWFWVVFALGYWVTDIFGAYPSTDVPLIRTGLDGVIAAAVYGLVCGPPGLDRVWLAAKARRGGGGVSAVIALVLDLVIAVGMFALAFT
jgi:hypothetical protein